MTWAFLDQRTPYGFAHQGGDEVAPGNTRASFEHAVSLGYRYIETDLQATSDGVLVVFHDEDLSATTDGSGRIEDQTWAEVSELRIAGRHPLQRFDEVLESFPEVLFNIEPKADTAVGPLIEAIGRHDLVDRICVGSFDDARLRKIRAAIGPRLAMSPGPLGMVRVLLFALFRPGAAVPYAAVQIPPRFGPLKLTGPWLIKRFHRLGLQVHVWTINSGPEMERLIANGVDVIMSDKISLLAQVLADQADSDGAGDSDSASDSDG